MLLTDFPLAWRWTDERHDLLPEGALSSIHPFSFAAAHEISQEAIAIERDINTEKTNTLLKKRVIAECGVYGVTDWLLLCHSSGQTPITISWDSTKAVSTTWETFALYWSAFCYAASDDVTVWSEGCGLALSFHHDGVFTYREHVRD